MKLCLTKFHFFQKSQTNVFGEMNKDLTNDLQSLNDEIDTTDNLLRRYRST